MTEEKYWIFDGKDAQGPFRADELKRQLGFGPETLICPDGAESADLWRPARHYLIRPPSAAPEPAKAPQSVRAPAPALVVEPVSGPETAPSRVSPTAVALVVMVIGAGGLLTYMVKRKAARQAQPPATAAGATAPAPEPPRPTVNEEAVNFVLTFPALSQATQFPASVDDVLSRSKWRSPRTVGEALEFKAHLALAQSAAALLQKQGHSAQMGELEIRRSGGRWQLYGSRFLKMNHRVDWTTEPQREGVYRVTAAARYHKSEPAEPHVFEADLGRRTLKPLNLDAWFDVDPTGCAKWGDANVKLGESVDEAKLMAGAPAYPFPLPRHKQGRKPPAGALAAQKPPEKAAPKGPPVKPAPPKPAGPPAEEADYPDEEAEAAASQITSEGRPAPAPQTVASPPPPKKIVPVTQLPGAMPDTVRPAPPKAQEAPKPAKTAESGKPSEPAAGAKPAPAPTEAGPPPAQEPAGKSKNATEMTPDELEKYLRRGAK